MAKELNKKIPQDLKIVGYDDINVANLVVPSLTTVRQPIKEIARKAIELLLRQIDGEKVEKENILPVTLMERETT